MAPTSTLCAALLLTCGALAAPAIPINGGVVGHTFDGHGALSAGASSRLLWDYPEPHRSHILDYLFLPQFGAAIQILKVEIGGDTQSTDGSEPSPQRTRDDTYDCSRGYEAWLLTESKKRNPAILTWALSWGVPYWIGNGSFFTQDNIDYQTNFVSCVKEKLGITLDYIGGWAASGQRVHVECRRPAAIYYQLLARALELLLLQEFGTSAPLAR